MIPRRLKLRNFLSYRECSLDLTGLHIAVLSGRNGDGKSALLDAMSWALWGEGRGKLEDDKIHLGQQEMLVDFEFEVSGDLFDVVRKRTRGRAASLELFQLGPDGARTALTGGTIGETQREILCRVRMDFDTFANSAYLAQGRADEFTRRAPAQRKEVFRKILGLERYEELSSAANDRKKETAATLHEVERQVGEARDQLAQLPEVEEALLEAGAASARLAPRIMSLEEQVSKLRQAALDYQRLLAEAQTSTDRATAARATVDTCELTIERLHHEQADLARLLAEGDQVAARHERLLAVRASERRLADLQAEARQHESTIAAAETEIAGERTRLTAAITTLQENLSRAESLAATLPGVRLDEGSCRDEHAELVALETRLEAAVAADQRLRERCAGLDSEAGQLRKLAQELKERSAQLDGVAVCPVCRQPLSPGDLDHVRDEYAAQRRTLGDQYHAALEKSAQTKAEADLHGVEAAALQRDLRSRKDSLHAREIDLHQRLTIAEEATTVVPALSESLHLTEEILASCAFAVEAHGRLANARSALLATAYDSAAHAALRQELLQLDGVEESYRDWLMAGERSANLGVQVEREERDLESRRGDLATAQSVAAAASEALAAASDVAPRLNAGETELAAARQEEADLARKQGRLEQQQQTLRDLQTSVEAALDQASALGEEESLYGDLWRAFGKDGVQAMLIDQALPRIDRTANDMLDRMTGGRIHVALTTLRESATRGMVETLDIRISDDLGTRDYEMYSGGEAFRVDFALRIALARLLAERAGAELPTLIIDEGFGSQDAEGIDRLVEALTAISADFRLILVVTHIEELRERFDRRIEVTKDPTRGSFARVV